MTIPYHARPGAGFVVLLLTFMATVAFFVWGLRTPPLDEVWRLQIELRIGRGGGLTDREFDLLQSTLSEYPELADNMLEDSRSGIISANAGGVVSVGTCYLVRKGPDAPSHLSVAGTGSGRVEVSVRTATATTSRPVDAKDPMSWMIPNDGDFPQLAEVRVTEPDIASQAGESVMSIVVRLDP